jgi:hypothetical protein
MLNSATEICIAVRKLKAGKLIFQVLASASMNMTVFWYVAPCSLVEV